MKFILASASPRRKELLKMIGIDFEIQVSDYEENNDGSLTPEELVKKFAYNKALDVFNKQNEKDDIVVIGADTMVTFDNMIYGKPKNKENAFDTLNKLQGNVNTVYSGLAVITKEKQICFSDKALVYFKQMTSDEIWEYINSGEPMDKAGSYAVQGKGACFIDKIEGDYSAIIGLSISRLYDVLKELNIE